MAQLSVVAKPPRQPDRAIRRPSGSTPAPDVTHLPWNASPFHGCKAKQIRATLVSLELNKLLRYNNFLRIRALMHVPSMRIAG